MNNLNIQKHPNLLSKLLTAIAICFNIIGVLYAVLTIMKNAKEQEVCIEGTIIHIVFLTLGLICLLFVMVTKWNRCLKNILILISSFFGLASICLSILTQNETVCTFDNMAANMTNKMGNSSG